MPDLFVSILKYCFQYKLKFTYILKIAQKSLNILHILEPRAPIHVTEVNISEMFKDKNFVVDEDLKQEKILPQTPSQQIRTLPLQTLSPQTLSPQTLAPQTLAPHQTSRSLAPIRNERPIQTFSSHTLPPFSLPPAWSPNVLDHKVVKELPVNLHIDLYSTINPPVATHIPSPTTTQQSRMIMVKNNEQINRNVEIKTIIRAPDTTSKFIENLSSTTNQPTEPPTTINQPTEPSTTINQPTEHPTTINQPTEPPITINQPTETSQPTTTRQLTESPITTKEPTESSTTIRKSTESSKTIIPILNSPSIASKFFYTFLFTLINQAHLIFI